MLSRLPDLEKTIRPKIGKFIYLHQPESIDVVSPPRPREDHQAKDWYVYLFTSTRVYRCCLASQTSRRPSGQRLVSLFIYINQSLQMLSRLPDLKKTIRPKIGKFIYLHQPESIDVVSPPRPREDHQAKDWYVYLFTSTRVYRCCLASQTSRRPSGQRLVRLFIYINQSIDVVSPPRPREDHQAKDW